MSEFGCASMAGSATNSPLHTHLILVCQEQKLVKGHMTKLLLMARSRSASHASFPSAFWGKAESSRLTDRG